MKKCAMRMKGPMNKTIEYEFGFHFLAQGISADIFIAAASKRAWLPCVWLYTGKF